MHIGSPHIKPLPPPRVRVHLKLKLVGCYVRYGGLVVENRKCCIDAPLAVEDYVCSTDNGHTVEPQLEGPFGFPDAEQVVTVLVYIFGHEPAGRVLELSVRRLVGNRQKEVLIEHAVELTARRDGVSQFGGLRTDNWCGMILIWTRER